jgi:hypothetical protein
VDRVGELRVSPPLPSGGRHARQPLPSSGSLGSRFATFPGTIGCYDSQHPVSTGSGLPCPPIPRGHPLVRSHRQWGSDWRWARGFFNPGPLVPASRGRALGLPSSRVSPLEACPALWTPVVSPTAPPHAGEDAAFHAGERVGPPRPDSFRGSMTRPASSLLLAPYDRLLGRTQALLSTCWRALAERDFLFQLRAPAGKR